MLKFSSDAEFYRLLFFISAFIFLSFATAINVFGIVSSYVQVASFVGTAGFFLYAFFFLTNPKKVGKIRKYVLIGLFFVVLLDFVLVAVSPNVHVSVIAYLLSGYEYIAAYFVLLLPLIFLTFFGAFLYWKKYRKIAYALFALAILVMIFYFFSGLVFHHYKIDDEVLITFLDSKILLAGGNPYSTSVSSQVFYNTTSGAINSPSITTTNKIIGTLNYPSLYLLSFLPFYLMAQPTIANLADFDIEMQQAVFMIVLLLLIAFSIDRKLLERPAYGIILFVTIALAYLSSVTIYLMLILLILAYTKLESRYSWIFLGLCASLQEQLWIPVVLLTLYSFRNEGFRKGMVNLIGATGVFLLLNAYFIWLSPSAFLGSVFGPIHELLLPQASSPIGYLITTNYPILLSSFATLFVIAILIVSLLFLYFNEKRLVGLFSMLPFVFLSHSIPVYYTFFMGFLAVTLFVKEEKKKQVKGSYIIKNPTLIYASLFGLIVLGGGVIYYSHLSYLSNFDITATNQSVHFDSAINKTIYTSTLTYHNLSNSTVYLFAAVVTKYDAGYAGIMDTNIIENSQKCSDYECLLNVNRIDLNQSNSTYKVRVYLGPDKGQPIYAVRLSLYNGDYYYPARGIFNQSILQSAPK
ncbi:MAG TPA: hypothetical protein VNF06_03745 [Candidatus Aquilonibacter sp.]|nr:hypothetical protein [Candidatus Aquilonibacter sp.]